MNLRALILTVGVVLASVAPSAQGQPVINPLLVANQLSFNALDVYDGNSGAYRGPFAGNGTGPPGIAFFDYGPNGNIFLRPNASPSPILQYNAFTGNFINTFVASSGGNFTFGPDGNLYRIEGIAGSLSQSVRRYNGSNGQLIGSFIPTNLNIARRMRFGPGGDLFIADDAGIRRFDGTSGQDLGPFTQPGAGGGGSVFDFLFTPAGRLLVTAGTDAVLEFDGTTGDFVGQLAQGNGLNVPYGMTIGPDGNLYVASTIGNSVKRFDLVSGAFLGDLISTTAHSGPNFLAFSPNPVPEPSSWLLTVVAVSVCWSNRAGVRVFAKLAKNGRSERILPC